MKPTDLERRLTDFRDRACARSVLAPKPRQPRCTPTTPHPAKLNRRAFAKLLGAGFAALVTGAGLSTRSFGQAETPSFDWESYVFHEFDRFKATVSAYNKARHAGREITAIGHLIETNELASNILNRFNHLGMIHHFEHELFALKPEEILALKPHERLTRDLGEIGVTAAEFVAFDSALQEGMNVPFVVSALEEIQRYGLHDALNRELRQFNERLTAQLAPMTKQIPFLMVNPPGYNLDACHAGAAICIVTIILLGLACIETRLSVVYKYLYRTVLVCGGGGAASLLNRMCGAVKA